MPAVMTTADPARVQAETQAVIDLQTRDAQEAAEAAEAKSALEEQQAAARERQEQCDKYRERDLRFTESRRIYRMDENGERIWYSDEEMQAAREELKELLAKYCS